MIFFQGANILIISMLRTVILYSLVIFAVRLMGKRQISQLQTSELVVTMLISDLAVIPMQDSGQPLFSGIIPMLVLAVLEVFLSVIMLKNARFRHLVCGNPVIVIEKGRIDQKNMRALRMSIDELIEQLRQKEIFNLSDVEYAIVETNGTLSVFKYAKADYIRPTDMGVVPRSPEPDFVLISDGQISYSSLELCRKSEHWLYGILNNERVLLEDVFIMTSNPHGKYKLIRRESMK